MSPEQDQKYLGNGIAEELLNALASIDAIKVAARTSSFSLASRGASMKEIGEALHVRHVLEGSVRRSGRKLRVTAQLIDVESGFHLFSQSYDRTAEDIFDIQNEIAREIATALLPKLGLGKDVMLVRHGTTNLEAYNLRLKARPWLSAPNPATIEAAIVALQKALELDREYWDAWADLAYVLGYSTSWTGDPVQLLLDAESAATLALYHSPSNVVALLWRAFVSMLVRRDLVAGEKWYECARAAGADMSLWAFQKAYCYDAPLGKFDDAIAKLQEAERQDPLNESLKAALIEMCLASGRPAEGMAAAEKLIALGPRGADTVSQCGRALLAAGDTKRAQEFVAKTAAVTGANGPPGMVLQFEIHEVNGDRGAARDLLDEVLRLKQQDDTVPSYLIGSGFRAVGEYETAIEWWERAADRHETWSLTLMSARNRNHPVIGQDPRFHALLQRMGLVGVAEVTAPR
jgi:TolB-like protein